MDNKLIRSFQKIVGRQQVLVTPADLLLYSYDSSTATGRPEAVVFPATTEEVAKVVQLCARHGRPFIARGAGTNLSGGSAPTRGGVVIALTRMNRVLTLDTENFIAVVQPGVVNLDLQQLLTDDGLQFCPDPASQKVSTIGGNAAENAGGPHCLKYGVMVNHVLGLTVVLPSGEVRTFGGLVADQPGLDLVGAFIGSEGTLGVVTEVVVRLRSLPEDLHTVLAVFETLEAAGDAVSRIIAEGITPAALEMMDRQTIAAVEASFPSGLPLDVEAILLIELDGLRESLARQVEQCAAICRRFHARSLEIGRTPAERERLWSARRSAYGATARLSAAILVNDATVPRSRLPEVLRAVQEIERAYGSPIAKVFHAGDGNLHFNILYARSDPAGLHQAEAASEAIFKVCTKVGGTLTGEHGIGAEKVQFMHLLFSENDLAAQRKLKRVFDPAGLANPGKVLPEVATVGEAR